MEECLKIANANNQKVFLLGAKNDVVMKAEQKLLAFAIFKHSSINSIPGTRVFNGVFSILAALTIPEGRTETY
jgi:hypothetical protein